MIGSGFDSRNKHSRKEAWDLIFWPILPKLIESETVQATYQKEDKVAELPVRGGANIYIYIYIYIYYIYIYYIYIL